MAQKIFDILPPKKRGKEPSVIGIEEKKIEEISKGEEIQPSIEKPKLEFYLLGGKNILIFILFISILVGIIFHFALSKAEIGIWPEAEIKTLKTKVTVSKEAKEIDLSNNVIPGEMISAEKTVAEEFPSSGKEMVEKKAEGVIRIYNNYNLSQTLVQNTRFQPPLEEFQNPLEKGENPWFRTQEKIIVPSKGYKDVRVKAEAAGEKYNIGPATFSIPGLAGAPQYTFVYGKSFEAMTGGLKKEVSQVTESDLESARKTLEEKALKEITTDLKNKISSEFDFLEGAVQTKILESFSLILAGAESEKFNFRVKAKAETLTFKKEDLKKFVDEVFLSQISEDQKVYQPTLKIDYSPEKIQSEENKIILNLEISAKIYSEIDEDSLKKGLAGKSTKEAQLLLEDQPKIIKTQVKIFPFWLKNLPSNVEKIKIKLNLD